MEKEVRPIRYFSTNRYRVGGFIDEVFFPQALIMGQAPDGGLFMPSVIPQFSDGELEHMMCRSYPEVAAMVLRKWFHPSEISFAKMLEIVNDAYKFPVPLEHVIGHQYIMRLDQGPTASFKDFAALALARLMAHFRKPGQDLHVLVATSGDTGSAVGEAFKGVEGTRVTILYPEKEVSGRQKKQLDTIGGNVQAIAIQGGKFDDCQDMVKQAFSDKDLEHLNLTSANSINIGRILPQIIYYFYAYAKLAEKSQRIIFYVPSGNFGDMMGAELARRMGLPIEKIIVATNENNEFPVFMETGKYSKISPSRACLSSAMNVGHPSNLARLFELYNGNVDKDGKVWQEPNTIEMGREIFSVSVSDEETRQTIKNAYDLYDVILEQHGAVGWHGLEIFQSHYRYLDDFIQVCLETAHPAKFPEEIKSLLGIEPELPDSLKSIDQRTGEAIVMPAEYEAFKQYLLIR